MARTATGVDVGLRTTKILRGQYKGKTFHVTDFALSENAGVPGSEDWVSTGWESVEPGFKLGSTRVGVTGRDVNVRYTRVPQVPDWQLRNLMQFEVAEIGDQSGTEVASDFNLLPALPEVDSEDVVILALARESLLEQHLQGLKAAGGSLDCFSPGAVALYNVWTHYGVVEDDNVLIANIGHDNIDVVISRGPDLLFARNLSGGSRLFDDAIAQRFNVGPEQAESLKLELATLRPGAQYATPNHERASRAILGAAGQVLSLLQSAVLFCKSQVKVSGLRVDRVMLCGGGAALDGLPQYLSAGMNIPVELFDAFRVVETSRLDSDTADLLEEYKLESVVALGLATMGSDPEAYGLEILPAATARTRAFWGGTVWLIAAAVLALSYLGFKSVHLAGQLDEVNNENAGLMSRLSRATRIDNDARRLIKENEELRAMAEQLQGVAGLGEQGARTMALLDRTLPRDFWVSSLNSEWTFDPELGVERGMEKPLLLARGKIRPGTDSPSRQFQEMMRTIRSSMPTAQVKESIDRDMFSVDLTLFGVPDSSAQDPAPEEGE